jgi:hypothetical protein
MPAAVNKSTTGTTEAPKYDSSIGEVRGKGKPTSAGTRSYVDASA